MRPVDGGTKQRAGRRGKALGLALAGMLALCAPGARAAGGTAADGLALAGQRQ